MTVVFGVRLCGFRGVVSSMAVVTVSGVRVMRRLMVVTFLVVLGGFAVMLRRVFVVLRSLGVMVGRMSRHFSCPPR